MPQETENVWRDTGNVMLLLASITNICYYMPMPVDLTVFCFVFLSCVSSSMFSKSIGNHLRLVSRLENNGRMFTH